MNAVIFARGANVEKQVKECREYAERQGYTVNCVIVGGKHEITGTIKSLQSDIKIDRLIVWDLARISRNALENYTIQAELELDCGVLVEVARLENQEEVFGRFMKNVIMAAKMEEDRETEMRIKLRMRGYDI